MPVVALATPLARKIGNGGHAWFVLNHLLGFRKLGWDVVLVDRIDVDFPSESGAATLGECTRWLINVLGRHGLSRCWTLALEREGREVGRLGLDRHPLLDALRGRSLLVDVMGFAGDAEVRDAANRSAYLDIDPGFGQMWQDLGLVDNQYEGYDAHFTVGLNVGEPSCSIPGAGVDWVPTLPPVVLDEWGCADPPPAGAAMTTVASWRGAYGPVDHGGRRYGLRVHEFRRFLDLPADAPVEVEVEVALAIDDADERDHARLLDHDWRLADPAVVAGDPAAYRQYIRGSLGELAVAKEMYVASESGWFSDRTACYLASGRPAVVQETGTGLATGEGLLTFRTPAEAARCLRALVADYDDHAKAARVFAEHHLASDVVLGRLLEIAGA